MEVRHLFLIVFSVFCGLQHDSPHQNMVALINECRWQAVTVLGGLLEVGDGAGRFIVLTGDRRRVRQSSRRPQIIKGAGHPLRCSSGEDPVNESGRVTPIAGVCRKGSCSARAAGRVRGPSLVTSVESLLDPNACCTCRAEIKTWRPL
ncbi:hypothetical protein NDU88_005077 [Pleurodeles waltl]|uniref:Secreted protein n=1 Tax=Pleurodeles waltl TaxID=8319 RepID=A0AAV7SKR2_PLEWA|nr:hypothetical protein NDU88_005077 [Pleurodeles waltl]